MDQIATYIEYCRIDSDVYKAGIVIWNDQPNVFTHQCVPYDATYNKLLKTFQCKACFGVQ